LTSLVLLRLTSARKETIVAPARDATATVEPFGLPPLPSAIEQSLRALDEDFEARPASPEATLSQLGPASEVLKVQQGLDCFGLRPHPHPHPDPCCGCCLAQKEAKMSQQARDLPSVPPGLTAG
jgi:hypothetical protein